MEAEDLGLTYAKINVAGEKGSEQLELLVDTGSVFTWIPADVLRKLGVKSTGKRRFRTIEGRGIDRIVGEFVLELLGKRATTIAVFAEKGDASVLGAYSLEGLGFEVDPTTKQLKKVEAFIA